MANDQQQSSRQLVYLKDPRAGATLRRKTYPPIALALMAVGLVVLSIQGLTHRRIIDELPNLSPHTRPEVFVRTTTLLIGVWATSYALRVDQNRRRESEVE